MPKGHELLGEWWIANPSEDGDEYEPPESPERVPGTLREIAHGEFALETIGFLSGAWSLIGGGSNADEGWARTHIWGQGRDERHVSLLDCFPKNRTMRLPSVAGGHEDWVVGWLAKGAAWVTPEDRCTRSWLRANDLRSWALDRRPESPVFIDFGKSAMVDLQEETLGTTRIGEVDVSLVRRADMPRQSGPGSQESIFTVNDAVSWKLEGSITLRDIAEHWSGCVEDFDRFMTMTPAIINGVQCRLADSDRMPLIVEVSLPRLPRDDAPAFDATGPSSRPHEFLTTWDSLTKNGIDPMQVFARYVTEVALGDAYVAMTSHLESQDRLLSQGADGALLNGVRSIEAQFAFENPSIDERSVAVQDKIDKAANRAGDVGQRVCDAWAAFSEINDLRTEVAHGKSRPVADFGLRCLGGSWSLQWLQRFHLLRVLGVSETAAETMICENPRFGRDLGSLQMWSSQL